MIPSEKMIILGLHTMGHDTGACVFQDGKLLFAIETERLTRKKHDGAVQAAISHSFEVTGISPDNVDCVAFSTNTRNRLARIRNFAAIEREIVKGARLHAVSECRMLNRSVPCVVVAHEAAHAAVASHFAGWRENGLIFVNEGRGTFSRNSCFELTSAGLSLIDHDALPWYETGFGWSLTAYLLGFGSAPSSAGTTMAMGAFAEPGEQVGDIFLGSPPDLHNLAREDQLARGGSLVDFVTRQVSFAQKATVVATLQDLFTTGTVAYLKKKLESTKSDWLGLSGGCALNLPTNTLLRAEVTGDVVIPPNCNDSGQALGAALYAQRICGGITPKPFGPYVNGQSNAIAEVRKATEASGLRLKPYDAKVVARRLAQGSVVAMCQGQSEVGPRALGNRSLLASAHLSGMKQKVSEQIKGREWFRPLACVMRVDRFRAHFPNATDSPFMLFNYQMPNDLAPEATHHDGTSRIQTLDPMDNPRLAALLEEYEAMTGHQSLINTSLNSRGRAIAYSAGDVLADFLNSAVDLFVFDDLMTDIERCGGKTSHSP